MSSDETTPIWRNCELRWRGTLVGGWGDRNETWRSRTI